MIKILTGNNSFEIDRFIDDLSINFDGLVERLPSYKLNLNSLLDIISGVDLFSTNKLIIIRGLSDNKQIWSNYVKWLDKVSDKTDLILIEPSLDKRTSVYKKLLAIADIKEFNNWQEKDYYKAEKWLEAEASRQGIILNKKIIHYLVNRVGVDQWRLYHALLKIALLDDIDETKIDEVIEPSVSENVFNLVETVIKGDIIKMKKMLEIFRQTEDIYRLNSLLVGQFYQLVIIKSANREADINKDFKIHPFVIKRLNSLSKLLSQAKLLKIVDILTNQDKLMKSVQVEPWVIFEESLFKIAKITM